MDPSRTVVIVRPYEPPKPPVKPSHLPIDGLLKPPVLPVIPTSHKIPSFRIDPSLKKERNDKMKEVEEKASCCFSCVFFS